MLPHCDKCGLAVNHCECGKPSAKSNGFYEGMKRLNMVTDASLGTLNRADAFRIWQASRAHLIEQIGSSEVREMVARVVNEHANKNYNAYWVDKDMSFAIALQAITVIVDQLKE